MRIFLEFNRGDMVHPECGSAIPWTGSPSKRGKKIFKNMKTTFSFHGIQSTRDGKLDLAHGLKFVGLWYKLSQIQGALWNNTLPKKG